MKKTPTKRDLQKCTDDFFNLHWCDSSIGNSPLWSEEWNFLGTIPNNDKQGCYALLKKEEIFYIGVGAGIGSGRYIGAGLGNRLHRIWRKHSKKLKPINGIQHYEPTVEWQETTSLVTIGFESKYSYLAYALESYLIRELDPSRNTIGKSDNKK